LALLESEEVNCAGCVDKGHIMDELGFDYNDSVGWFVHEQEQPYVLVNITHQQAEQIVGGLAEALRRCYITDELMEESSAKHNVQLSDVLASKLPDPGSTMAGDFGEILCYVYQSTKELPANAVGVKKWRLKQDRTKPAPKTDVVHFLMPNGSDACDQDVVFSAEVKVKSTTGKTTPIASAIEDCAKDRTSRLASTLVWLRERAMTESLGDVNIPMLDRFIKLDEHPPASKRFRAIAVICDSLSEEELQQAPDLPHDDYEVVVIVVPNLKDNYEALYRNAHASVQVQP
jgi:hypothetical protein